MQSIGHPLFHDMEYGGDRIVKGTTFGTYKKFVENCFIQLTGQALHAKTLGFNHPRTKERISFDSELPQNYIDVLDKWRRYSKSNDYME